MRANAWPVAAQRIDLERIVTAFDRSTRQDGFHVLHDWDGKADRVNEDTIPVDVLTYLIERRGGQAPDRRALAILVDYHFFHILALFSLRIWDEGDADANLDRVSRLLAALQGPDGSGQRLWRTPRRSSSSPRLISSCRNAATTNCWLESER
jgi:hypothetical protein